MCLGCVLKVLCEEDIQPEIQVPPRLTAHEIVPDTIVVWGVLVLSKSF